MGTTKWFVLLVALVLVGPSLAATQSSERPDREMLRIMEFLREMEMIKQMEMMQDMQNVEPVVEPTPGTTAKIPGAAKKKEATK
jgi:HAMP domain-containing protein